jgi:hypothetical protein
MKHKGGVWRIEIVGLKPIVVGILTPWLKPWAIEEDRMRAGFGLIIFG